MLRPTRKQATNPAVSNGATHNSNTNNKDYDSRGRSKSFLPKGSIGTLIILVCVALFLVGHRLLGGGDGSKGSTINNVATNQSYGDGSSGPSGGLRVKSIQNNNPIASSSQQRLRSTDTVGLTSPTTNNTLHLIFSTDCSPFQHWQSYLFFHAALQVSQPGYVTRIASGCTDEQLAEEEEWHRVNIQEGMSERFRVHFTPHFSGVKDEVTGEVKGDYKFFNKPFGLKHFLEYSEFMGLNEDDGRTMKAPDVIVILCDPDFLLLRPITDDFSNERETLMSPRRSKVFSGKSKIVSHGHPYAQTYGLGTQWRKFNLDEIAGVDSPAKLVDQSDGQLYYPGGPPYIGTARDMYRIAEKWSEFAPRVHKEYPHLLAEMCE
jgi:hypothetical protein